jgi:hypothetical protein
MWDQRLASSPGWGRQLRRATHLLAGPAIILVLAPIAIPFTQPGFPWGHDTPPHLANAFRFDRALWQGQFPVRWAEGLRPGSGQPLFNFYQVGFYYFLEALRATGIPLSAAFKLAPALLWWVGALFTWRWLQPFGPSAAFAGSVTFGLSPYVILDVFVRAAYPEFMAIVGIAGTLWATDAFLRRGHAGYLPALSGLVALLLISHLPACLIGAPLLIGQPLVRTLSDEQSRSRLPSLLLAAALGCGLASFYVIPALSELHLVSMWRLTMGGVDYRNNFVPAQLWIPRVPFEWNYFGTVVTGRDSLLPVQISIVQWAAIIGSAAWLITRPWRRARFAASCVVLWLATIALALFMMHAVSGPIWTVVPALAVLQFPWRFFLLLSIAAAGLTAALISQIDRRLTQLSCAALVVGVHMYFYYPHLKPGGFVARSNMNIDDPRWIADSDPPPRTFEELGYDPAGTSPDPAVSASWSLLGAGAIEPVSHTDAAIVVRIAAPHPVALRFNIPAFPGWSIAIDGIPTSVAVAPNGYMLVSVPAGSHVVRAAFENTPIRLGANALSLISAVLLPIMTNRRRQVSPPKR